MAFGCDDTVVIGSLVNGDYHPIENDDDLLGHGVVDARLHVRRVIRGARTPTVFPVRYFTHATFRENLDFLFVLRGNKRNGFMIREARLMEDHPRLARRRDPQIDG